MNILMYKLAGRGLARKWAARSGFISTIFVVTNCAISAHGQPQNAQANAKPPLLDIDLKARCFEITVGSMSQEGIGALVHDFTSVVLTTNCATNGTDFNTVAAVLNDQQYRAVLKALPDRGWTESLTFPEVTTECGRPVEIFGTTNPLIAVPLSAGQSATRPVNLIRTPPTYMLHVTPDGGADGYSFNLSMLLRVTNVVGFIDPGQFVPQASIPTGGTITSVLPLPHFRIREWSAGATAWDGQTIVMGLVFETRIPIMTSADGGAAGTTRTLMLLFVTPTSVNADGIRYHSMEEMNSLKFANPPPPFSTDGVSTLEKGAQ